MQTVIQMIKDFFLPPPGSPTWRRVLPYGVLGILTLVVLSAAVYGWEYTNSPQFCGETCHTMPPEYTAYLTSPHARVACVDCHIGKDFITTRITRKAGDVKHIISLAFKQYEYPIRADDLRPARDTCEKCHFPEKFSDDSLRQIKQFAGDEENSPSTLYLVMKTGGGSKRAGLGRGIHWHIENPVRYLATDPEEQSIPYIQVENEDGSTTEYVDIEANIDPDSINPDDLKEMDCITCHNRITHLVNQPEDIVDTLLSLGAISSTIPEIKEKAVAALREDYESKESALSEIGALEGYYQTVYPDFYADNQQAVSEAVSALQSAYDQSVFPEQKSDWDSHPNNIGHQFSPGCFRCHDGKHLNTDQEAVRLECNLCHAIPVVADSADFLVDLEISRGPEPESHLNPNWINLHHSVYNETCSACHTTDDPGGTSDTSFCSNSACHGRAWDYAGFDAPGLREILVAQLPPTPTPTAEPPAEPTAAATPAGRPTTSAGQPTATPQAATYSTTIQPIFENRCGACHGTSKLAGLKLTEYGDLMEGSDSGPVIVPGDPDASLLVQKQTASQPHFAQLSSSELETVIQWIAAGAPE